ncbi:carbohydrate kinase [Cesiribacter sp. SM1]|uniref:carbohydrate kinase family protein n=1 Tax=Cesiribacter sp. SM1 TaxID=2861196 RepID=UPI001CD22B22|nr:carbohydrate kinase [Cesiribacter sp. SM1]
MRILSFGEILFDIIEGEHYLGGAPLNFAAHLAQLGAESYIYSKVGRDELGKYAVQQISGLGVKTDFVQHDEAHPTGTVPVEFIAGQPSYTITEHVAYDYIQFEAHNQVLVKTEFDVLYFGTLAQRSGQSREALQQLVSSKKYTHIFYDINLRKNCYTPLVIQHSLELCTILKLNDDEVNVLSNIFYGQALTVEEFTLLVSKDYHIPMIIITAGEKGCYLFYEEALHFIAGYPATVVDTVGAGDSFSAAFIHHYFKKKDAMRAADIANRMGAFVASSRGPLPPYSAEIKSALMLS